MHLMQLSLVDVATGLNSEFKMTDESAPTNSMIAFILQSKISYKLIFTVIRMTSINFLKPFQLQTAMCYAEIKYHSNDYTFMQIMADVLNVTKMQLKFWKEEANAAKGQREEESKQIESHTGLNKYNPGANTHLVREKVTNLIQITEKQARDKLSEMIGEKIIGKVYQDNLKDF